MKDEFIAEKCGTVTISVYKNEKDKTVFLVESDNENVCDVEDIVKDFLYYY